MTPDIQRSISQSALKNNTTEEVVRQTRVEADPEIEKIIRETVGEVKSDPVA
jgi:hypothetical protein